MVKSPAQDKAIKICLEYLETNKKFGTKLIPRKIIQNKLRLTKQRMLQLQTALQRKGIIKADAGKRTILWKLTKSK